MERRGEARIASVHGGVGHFARVCVRLLPAECAEVRIDASACTGAFEAEQPSRPIPSSWLAGATSGISMACQVAALPAIVVEIEVIEGTITDTNPTIVAVAAAKAVWNAVSFEVAPSLWAELDDQVRQSSHRHPDHVLEWPRGIDP